MNLSTILAIAQVSSVITSIMGIVILGYVVNVLRHLLKDDFRKIFSVQGIFFLVALVGVMLMTVYHVVDGTYYERYSDILDDGWFLFMFLSMPIALYNSSVIIKFGRSVEKIRSKISKHKK